MLKRLMFWRKPRTTCDDGGERLANYIMFNVPGEPSQDQGAVDTAIRLITICQMEHVTTCKQR
jgi:hypothetical protein